MTTAVGENTTLMTRPSLSRRRTRVLIADDSPTVRERLVTLLGDLHDVDVVGQAEDEAETVSLVRSLRPDVVILDIRMPEGSGIGVLRSLRNERERPKFIVLTNYPYLAYRRTCLEAGASYFFDKSSEFEQIPQALEQLTRKVS